MKKSNELSETKLEKDEICLLLSLKNLPPVYSQPLSIKDGEVIRDQIDLSKVIDPYC